MSAKAAEPAPATAPPKAKGKMKIVVIVLAAILVAGGAAAGGTWFFLNKKAAAGGEVAEAAHVPEEKKHAEATYLPLENLIVNLADPGGERVAQIGMTLDVQDEKTAGQLKTLMPVVRSKMLLLVSQRTAEELLKRDGKEKLAADVVTEVAHVLGNGDKAVRGVLFSSFIVQ